MIVLAIVLLAPGVGYLLFLAWLTFKLQSGLKTYNPEKGGQEPISVLVAAHNESATIGQLIRSVAASQTDSARIRIILSDDHSTDGTARVALEEADQQRISLTVCHPASRGKRAALDEAMHHTTDPWLAFTDADATVNRGWLHQMTAPTTNKNTVMVLGQIDMVPAQGWWGELQTAEYQSIASITAATALAGMPVMANGASMLVRADVYRQAVANGFQKNHLSGDDMFLLQYIKRKFGSQAIAYQPSPGGGVVIRPESSFIAFLLQRMRWVSKAGGYTDPAILSVSALVAVVNLFIIASVALAVFNPALWWIAGTLYGLKSLADAPLLFTWSKHTQTRHIITKWFIPLQLVYPFYSVGVAIAGRITKPVWR